MGQDDVLEILKTLKHGEGITSKEIHKKIAEKGKEIGLGSVTTNLKKLVRGKMVLKYYHKNKYQSPKYILVEKASDTIINSIHKLPYWMNDNGAIKCQSKKTVV